MTGQCETFGLVRDVVRCKVTKAFEEQLAVHRRALRSKATNPIPSDPNLPALLLAEIPQKPGQTPGQHVGWAFSVLSALIILSDGKVFLSPPFIKFVMNAIHACMSYQMDFTAEAYSGMFTAGICQEHSSRTVADPLLGCHTTTAPPRVPLRRTTWASHPKEMA